MSGSFYCRAITSGHLINIPSSKFGEGSGTPSSALAWRLPWTEERGRLRSVGSRRVGHGWASSLSLFTFMHWRRKWQPTPGSCLENPRNGGAWWAAVYAVAQSQTRLKRLSSSSSSSKLSDLLLGCRKMEFCRSQMRYFMECFKSNSLCFYFLSLEIRY